MLLAIDNLKPRIIDLFFIESFELTYKLHHFCTSHPSSFTHDLLSSVSQITLSFYCYTPALMSKYIMTAFWIFCIDHFVLDTIFEAISWESSPFLIGQ